MNPPLISLIFLTWVIGVPIQAQTSPTKRDIPYVENGHARQVLDVYAPPGAKDCPVVFWIHGGGWQVGDKSDVGHKPRWFTERGWVFVSTNYRLLPEVDMATLTEDVAKAFGWVQRHVAEFGGDATRVLVGGHSAGAQLAALLCTDERYVKAEGSRLASMIGCLPVDGDTYDIPAMIVTAETRLRVHGYPPPQNGHRQKFGHTAENHRKFSAVNHIDRNKGIPPFLILYVANHPDTRIQARRLGEVLETAEVPVRVFGAKDTDHSKLNDDLGLAEDPATEALSEFVRQISEGAR